MKRINSKNINTVGYWNKNIAEPPFGIRQQKYMELAGKGEKIVDLGCGMSQFLDVARISFEESWGVDFSLKTVQQAKRKYPEVRYILSKATDVPFEDNYFDVSVSGELIEHLEKPEELAREMNRITKDKMILSTANMEYNDPEHLWKFTKEGLIKLFSPYGKTTVEEVESSWFPGRSYLFVLCLKSSGKES